MAPRYDKPSLSAPLSLDTTDTPHSQLLHYHGLLSQSQGLQALFRAVINTEARWIAAYPYCGSFQPPPESGLPPTHNSWHDGVEVNPVVDTSVVFECKVRACVIGSRLAMVRHKPEYDD